MVRFVASGSSKKQPSDWLRFFDSQSEDTIQWFLKLPLEPKLNTSSERAWKMVSFLVYHFARGHLGVWKDVNIHDLK